MAEEIKKVEGDESDVAVKKSVPKAEKTVQIEITKFHPLVAHEVGDQPFVLESTAKDLIERKYAKPVK